MKHDENEVNVAELKRRFSEFLDAVVHRRARVTIRRRGKKVAALVPIDELRAAVPADPRGLAAAAGAWEGYPDPETFLKSLQRARRRSRDRKVGALEE